MCDPVTATIALATTVAGTVIQGVQANNAAKAAARTADQNARIAAHRAEIVSSDIRKRGEEEARQRLLQGRAIQGQQLAALANQGVLVGTGSALELELGTARVSATDAATIRANAERQAREVQFQGQIDEFNAKTAAANARAQGQAAFTNSLLKAGSTVLSESGTVASKWKSFNSGSTGGGASAPLTGTFDAGFT